MNRKIYKSLSRAKQGFFALALAVLSGTACAQATYTFNYTGTVQTISLPAGNYELECWGADGGAGGGTSPVASTEGKGGYTIGNYSLTSPATLYIYVGGKGQSNGAAGTAVVTAPGGWNGGGGGFSGSSSSNYKGGGGGGSDIRTTNNTTYANRIIVAGGGGGGGGGTTAGYVGSGGFGGGTVGQNGILGTSQTTHNGKGGTQTAGGLGGVYATSSIGQTGGFGPGGDGGSISGNSYPAGGGGGGWYGGGGGATQGGSGAGGSSFTGSVTSGATYTFGQGGYPLPPVTNGNGVVKIRELCSISLTATGTDTNTSICSGATVTLTTNGVSNYSWSTGASTSSLVVSPTVTTIYSLVATSPSNCTSSSIVTITVYSGVPTLAVVNTASATNGICPSKTVQITASGAVTYTWVPSITNGATLAPTNSNTWVVTGMNTCGTSTAATSVSIHVPPTVNGVASQPTICSGNPVNLTAVGNATGYVWSNGVGNGQNFYPSSTAGYTVIGTSAQSCTNSAVASITVVATPSNPVTASPPLICIGSTATLNAPGATNYTWTTPSGQFNTQSITVSPNITTQYTVTKANANCVVTQTVNLIVNQLPSVFAIAQPTLICASNPATLQGGGALTYTWNAGGTPNFTFAGAAPIVSPSVTTIYTVTASDGTCVNTTTVQLSTNPNPTITIAATSTNICFGDQVQLISNGAISYTWTTPTMTSNVNTATITEKPFSSTNYQIIGENSFSCTSTQQQVVVVRTTPTLNIQTTKPMVCTGGASNLTVSAVGLPPFTYTWDANAGSGSNTVVTVNPVTSTIYTVTGKNSVTCTAQQTVLVTVFLPTFAVNNPTSSCLGGSVNLIASGAQTYTWNGNQPFAQIMVSPSVATVYNCAATSLSLGVNCISTNSVLVSIYDNPTVTAVASRTQICKGESTNLTGGGASTYSWTTNLIGSPVAASPFINTTYTCTGVDQNGCIGTTTVLVKVSTCFGIDENSGAALGLSIYPNPSTGLFKISGDTEMQLQLSNETGQLLRIVNLNADNKYEMQIGDLPTGVYFLSGQRNGQAIHSKVVITR